MKKFALLLIAALIALVAFAQNAASTVEGTISTLQEGVTNVPLDVALANIEGWQTTLEASDDAALQDLGAQLGELATALQAESIDPTEVGGLLTSLGQGTITAAETAGDDQLATLGGLLEDAGSSLTGGSGGMTGGMTGGMSGGGM